MRARQSLEWLSGGEKMNHYKGKDSQNGNESTTKNTMSHQMSEKGRIGETMMGKQSERHLRGDLLVVSQVGTNFRAPKVIHVSRYSL